jgi:hypothetical protein
MSIDRTRQSAAAALVGGTIAGLITMALHPTGHDVVTNASGGGANTLNMAVHTLALLGQPLLLAGLLAFTLGVRRSRSLAVLAYVCFALAVAAVMIAAVASGLLAPAMVRDIAEADEAGRAAMIRDLHFTGAVNQAFARVHVIFSGLALALWGATIIRDGGPPAYRALGAFGLLAGLFPVMGVLTGRLRLDIHGFGLVVLLQGIWMVWLAWHLWRGIAEERA